jgi:hypothetical protein
MYYKYTYISINGKLKMKKVEREIKEIMFNAFQQVQKMDKVPLPI